MGKPVIMIVEDERDLADLYSEWLSDTYTVITAYNGNEALGQLDSSVDIVLLDRRMPDQSGDSVLEVIQDNGFECQVAMVTAVEPDFDIIDMGFDDYIVKPVSVDDLRDLVAQLWSRSSYDDEIREYFSLASKKALLEAEKTAGELESNPEYIALENEFTEVRDRADGMLEESPESFFEAAFRDLDPEKQA